MTSIDSAASGPHFVFGDGLPFGHEVESAEAYGRQASHLAVRQTRLALQRLRDSTEPEDQDIVRSISNWHSRDALGSGYAASSIRDTQEPIVASLAEADDDQLHDFCMWNTRRQIARQAALDDIAPTLRADALARAEQLVATKFFPGKAVNLFNATALAIGNPEAIDSFEAGGMTASGYFNHNDKRSALANQFTVPDQLYGISEDLLRTNFHEWVHGVGSVALGGYYRGITDETQALPLLEEVFASHAAQVATSATPLPEVLAPSRRDDKGSYAAEREFISLMAQEGPETIAVAEISEGFFESIGRSPARQALSRKLNHNFSYIFPEHGDEALSQLSEAYEATPPKRRSELVEDWISRAYEAYGYDDQVIKGSGSPKFSRDEQAPPDYLDVG